MEWLAGLGSDQWSIGLGEDGFAARVEASIDAGQTWVATGAHGVLTGTIAVDRWTNPGLWSAAELADAMIVHRMMTPLSAAGAGIGGALLRHADRLAVEAGYRWLRLDAWTTNRALHAFYERHGFRHIRTVTGHPSRSTALFERRARLMLPSTVRPQLVSLDGWRDAADNPIPPEHDHTVDDLVIWRPALLGSGTRLDVSPGTTWALWWQDGHWRLAPPGWAGRDAHRRDLEQIPRVERWPSYGPTLSHDAEYLIAHEDVSESVILAAHSTG